VKVEEIEIEKIIIPEQRARATFTDEQWQELKASIEKNGFNIPILVKDNGDGTYELIDGEHRIQIVKEMGWEKIPAVITDADEKKATLLNILANTARGTQNPMDVAEALKRAADAGADIKELASATGHTEFWVKLYLALNDLPDVYKEALRRGDLKVGHIQEAMRLGDSLEVDAALKTVLDLGWSVKVLKYYVDQRLAELEALRQAGQDGIVAPPPTPEQAEEYVNYGDCMFCHRKHRREELMMPVMCPDCRSLLEYILSQLGDPREALQTCYNALSYYFDMLNQQKKQQQVQQMISQQPVQQQYTQQPQYPPQPQPAYQPQVPQPQPQPAQMQDQMYVNVQQQQPQPAPQQQQNNNQQVLTVQLTSEEAELLKKIQQLRREGLL